jgi:hypothetical protein
MSDIFHKQFNRALLIDVVFWAVIVGFVFHYLTVSMGFQCEPMHCASSIKYGLALFVGSLFFVWAGFLILSYAQWTQTPSVYVSFLVGLLGLIVYFYVRSLWGAYVIEWGVRRLEVLVLMGLATLHFLYKRQRSGELSRLVLPKNTIHQLLLLLIICLFVASREMPRDVMLSSDPDSHAFYAKQVWRFGLVPFHQREWGPEGFNYPAITGVLLYLWHLFTGLDVRNLLTPLAVLFTFLAALLIADVPKLADDKRQYRLALYGVSVGTALAIWFYPQHANFFHMEGYGRQLSLVFSAGFLYFFVEWLRRGLSGQAAVVLALLVAVVTIFNPANIVIPSALLFGVFVHGLLQRQIRWAPAVVWVSALLLLLLDPYFQGILGIVEMARVDTVLYSQAIQIKPWSQVLSDAVLAATTGSLNRLIELFLLIHEVQHPIFITLLVILAGALFVVGPRRKPSGAVLGAVLAALLAFYLVYAFSMSLINDRRFYLLGPYVFLSMAHYKGMFLSLLFATCVAQCVRLQYGFKSIALLGLLGLMVVYWVGRPQLPIRGEPRVTYCGAMGCINPEDVTLLKRLEGKAEQGLLRVPGVNHPKVLLPNRVVQMGDVETWIFPAGSARAYPHFEILPAAFFYFQGHTHYSTQSYIDHVCNRLDMDWLRRHEIHYLYLPSQREGICVSGYEGLITPESTVDREGDALLIRLNF